MGKLQSGGQKVQEGGKLLQPSRGQPSAVPSDTFRPVSGLISGECLHHRLPMRAHSGC
jgi:hypothetical protein